MPDLIQSLEQKLSAAGNSEIAQQQRAYMRDQFDYYGIKAPERKEIFKPFFIKKELPDKVFLADLTEKLWSKPQREFQYFGQELWYRYRRRFTQDDITSVEYMIVHKSWWDTVDYIAVKLLGSYLQIYPEYQSACVERWLTSNNIWLQRSSLLFQLKYKQQMDTDLLTYAIRSLIGSNEFFINKAIGWTLREYSKTDPDWVVSFVKSNTLHALSEREALRLIKSAT